MSQQADASKTGASEENHGAFSTFEGEAPVDETPIHGLWAVTNRDLKKWYKNTLIVLLSLIQPVIWLGLFGKAMNFGAIFTGSSFSIPGLNIPQQELNALAKQVMLNTFGTTDYFSYLAAGMICFMALFMAMNSGSSFVWDRRLGFLNKELSTPLSRAVIPLGKVLASTLRALSQSAIVLVIAVLLGLSVSHFSVLGILGTFAALFLMVMGFSSLFLMLAVRSTNQDTQLMIVNLLNLPLVFCSNALFPAKFMPSWLQPVVKANPISYATDISRQLLLGSSGMASLQFDFLYLGCFAIVLTALGMVVSWRFLSR